MKAARLSYSSVVIVKPWDHSRNVVSYPIVVGRQPAPIHDQRMPILPGDRRNAAYSQIGLQPAGSSGSFACQRSKGGIESRSLCNPAIPAAIVFRANISAVIGPVPPGTGVIAPATL